MIRLINRELVISFNSIVDSIFKTLIASHDKRSSLILLHRGSFNELINRRVLWSLDPIMMLIILRVEPAIIRKKNSNTCALCLNFKGIDKIISFITYLLRRKPNSNGTQASSRGLSESDFWSMCNFRPILSSSAFPDDFPTILNGNTNVTYRTSLIKPIHVD